jgi:quinol-cytochrome oxidoreductase complex cytochrome b subunit
MTDIGKSKVHGSGRISFTEGSIIEQRKKKDRGGFFAFLVHLHPPLIPRERIRLAFSFCLGGLSFYLFLLLLVTGILLMFYYLPGSGEGAPYLSVREITEIVPFGDLFRNLHYWGGQGIVLLIFFHMIRVVVTGSYQGAKRWIWVVGMSLLVLVLILDFSGYLLRFDRETFWAGFVALGVVKKIPFVGESLHRLLTGTSTYGEPSIERIYVWHCVVLPITVVGFMIYHFWKVRRQGWSGQPL